MVIITSAAAMKTQAENALDAIRAACGGQDPPTLRDGYDADPGAFARLIEALVALGIPVAADMRDLAGLRPVDEVI